MIETRQFFPGFGGMANFACRELSILRGLPHELVKLALVRIGVASRASRTSPVVKGGRRLELPGLLVAIGAHHRQVTSSEWKLRFFVPRQSEGRWPEPIDV